MGLYQDQIEASDKFEDWLVNTDETCAGLWASAGFGKSYLAKHLVDKIILNTNYIPVVTSMTHSAVEVLEDFLGMSVSTLHSAMGWIPKINKDTGEEYLSTPRMRSKNAEPRVWSNNIVIVDEAGFMGHRELELLLIEVRAAGARLLFIGDNKQCFPVTKNGERLCIPAYEVTDCYLKLTMPKRVNKEDMIYKLSLKFREAVDGAKQPELKTALNDDDSGKGVRYVDDIEEYAYYAFKAGIRDGNTRNIKVLAFTNKRCLTLNRKIRKRVMGYESTTPVVGEEMVANTAIQTSTGDNILIYNNQKVIVKEVEETESFGLKGAFVLFTNLIGEVLEEVVFVPGSPGSLLDRLKKLAREAKDLKSKGYTEESRKKWRNFFSLKEGCADIRFTYAMTVNKAQGTTLKHVLVDLNNMNMCRDREQKTRLAYTAITRATDYVTIEGSLSES